MAKKPKNKNRGGQKPAPSSAPANPAGSNGRGRGGKALAAGDEPAPRETAVSASVIDSTPPDAGWPAEAPSTVSATEAGSDGAPMDAITGDASEHAPFAGSAAAESTDATDESGAVASDDNAATSGGDDAEPVVASKPPRAFDLGSVEVFDSGVGGGNADDIRGVLIQLSGARLLLPNATIAEVLSYAEPDAVEDTPDWLLGRIRWRGWQLPLIAFAQLAGITNERGGLGSKVVVLKALTDGGKTPYFAVLTQGFPRLVTVSRAALMVDEDTSGLPEAILAHVRLNQDDAYVPDLERVERMIGEAMAEAA